MKSSFYSVTEMSYLIAETQSLSELCYTYECVSAYRYKWTYSQLSKIQKMCDAKRKQLV